MLSVSKRPLAWYVPLWKFIGDYHWQDLESLRLDGLVVCEKGLADFLNRHAMTLRSLKLFNIALFYGSFRGLLSGLKVSLNLDIFCIWGTLRAFHTPYEAWRLRPNFDDDPEWLSPEFASLLKKHTKWFRNSRFLSPVEIRSGLESFMTLDIRSCLESFIILDIEWPFSEGIQRFIDPPYFGGAPHTGTCCAMSMVDIDEYWQKGLMKSLERWNHFEIEDAGEVGVELIEEYDENGFDNRGLNKDGFNRAGIHYRVIHSRDDGYEIVTEREILAGILMHMENNASISYENLDGGQEKWMLISPKE